MITVAGAVDVSSVAECAIFVAVVSVGYATISNRRRVRWAVHAKAEVIGLDAVPPVVRPVLESLQRDLDGLGFELAVVTRARQAVVRGSPRHWYRIAFLDRQRNDAACVEWWDQPYRRRGPAAWMSSVSVLMFRYAGPTGYAIVHCNAAMAHRSPWGDWTYDMVADVVSLSGQQDALASAAAGKPGEAFPFATTEQLVALIEKDTGHRLAAALARTTCLDRTGRWYRWTWRNAFLNALNPRRTRVAKPSAGRGFAVMTAEQTG